MKVTGKAGLLLHMFPFALMCAVDGYPIIEYVSSLKCTAESC
jgi:hypothetical protein